MPCPSSGRARQGAVLAHALVLLGAATPPPAAQPPQDQAARPHWIWEAAGSAGSPTSCRLRLVFDLGEPVVRAELRMTGDNSFTAYLDGERVLGGNEWRRSWFADVSHALRSGKAVLAVEARNDGGPAGLIGMLRLELASGARRTLSTGPEWQAVVAEDARWRTDPDAAGVPVAVIAPLGAEPWGDPFAPRFATPASALRVRPGYEVELLRSAADWQGSWVALAFDEAGCLYLSAERDGIFRLADPAGDQPPQPLVLPPAVRNVQGLAFAAGALWANVNRNDPDGGLYRLRDRNADGTYEEVDRVLVYQGDGEHGPHAVVPGPDGCLWIVNGNMTDLPPGLAESSPHRLYAEDVLLPPIEDPNGHAVGVKAPGCHVLRLDPDGSKVELFGAGLRNAYDLAFDRHGELYTFDSDMEWDLGLPWYRPVRVCRMVSGAEFGWRSGTGCWPVHWFDSLPAVLDVGRGSPTGLTFWYGSRVAAADHGALVAGDWALGRILLFQVDDPAPRAEVLAAGRPLNVTDLTVGPDGALWFITGGRGTLSGLYRIARTATTPEPAATAAPASLVAPRAARRRLEALHRAPTAGAVGLAWPQLAAADPEVRHAARIAVERQPLAAWRQRALTEDEPAAACAALLALARAGTAADLADLAARWLRLDLLRRGRERALEALRVLTVAFARHGMPPESQRAALAAALAAAPAGDSLFERDRAALLVFLRAPDLVPRLFAALQGAVTQADKIAYAYLLSHVVDGWSEDSLARFGSWLRSARDELGGGDSFTGYLEAIRDTLAERLTDRARRAQVAAWRQWPKRPAPAAAAPGPFVRAWTIADLQPHLAAVDHGRSFAAGERAAQSAQCVACHRIAGRGGSIGPDLSAVASRLSRGDLLQAILEPSKVVSEQYRLVVLGLRDGSAQAGRITRETSDTLLLLTDPVAGTTATVRAADVVSRTPSPSSAMPPGLLDSLTLEQILDLLAYLENDGDAKADAFQ